MKWQTAFRFLSLCSALAALYHVAASFGFFPNDHTSVGRHVVFVAIDLFGAWYALNRPPLLLPAFFLLVAQQTLSHGGYALRQWQQLHRIDVVSIGVIALLYGAAVLLVLDAHARRISIPKRH